MYPNTMGQRIEFYRTRLGLNQKELAERLKLAKSTMSQYESDARNPSDEIKLALCDLFNITLDELMGRKAKPESKSSIAVPVLDRISAGIPVDAIQNVEGWEEIPKALAGIGEYFAIKMENDSMSPTILCNSVVIVRKQNTVGENEIAVVQTGDDKTVKIRRVRTQENGIILFSDNSLACAPRYFTEYEVNALPVRIIGKVVEVRKRL